MVVITIVLPFSIHKTHPNNGTFQQSSKLTTKNDIFQFFMIKTNVNPAVFPMRIRSCTQSLSRLLRRCRRLAMPPKQRAKVSESRAWETQGVGRTPHNKCGSACLSMHLPSLSISISIYVYIYIYIYPPVCLSACLAGCLSVSLFVSLYLSVCLSVCQSIYLPTCAVRRYVHIYIYTDMCMSSGHIYLLNLMPCTS